MKFKDRLPDAEFDVMRAIWRAEPPVSTKEVVEALEDGHHWKAQTVLTLLVRLIDRGFLASERVGKERVYTPLVAEQAYLQQETDAFMARYHQNSLTGLVSTLFRGKQLSEEEARSLRQWLEERT